MFPYWVFATVCAFYTSILGPDPVGPGTIWPGRIRIPDRTRLVPHEIHPPQFTTTGNPMFTSWFFATVCAFYTSVLGPDPVGSGTNFPGRIPIRDLIQPVWHKICNFCQCPDNLFLSGSVWNKRSSLSRLLCCPDPIFHLPLKPTNALLCAAKDDNFDPFFDYIPMTTVCF